MKVWDIMNKELGISRDITVTFRKSVSVRPYETEVVEATTTIRIDKPISGSMRMLITACAQAQLEYEVYTNLMAKGLVQVAEFQIREKNLSDLLDHLKSVCESYNENVEEQLNALGMRIMENSNGQNV